MKDSFLRIKGILIKEVHDLRRNTNVVYMYALPVVLTLLWDRFIPNMPGGFALNFGLIFLVVMVGMYVPSMIIAEEKEKKTIEVLMLSPASAAEVFIGKGLLTFVSILIVSLILMVISAGYFGQSGVILISTALISIFSILIGMIVGLLAPNQMSTGIIGLPIYLILLLFPLYGTMGVELMARIARFLPTYYYMEMLRLAINEGQQLSDLLYHSGLILLSIVLSYLLLWTIYRKKGLE